jgi:hypothetical protein
MTEHNYFKPYRFVVYSQNLSFVYTKSLVWDETGQRLLFVDIGSRMLLEADPFG